MLKFLLIFLIIIYLVGFVFRLIVRNWFNKMTNQNPRDYEKNKKKEGDVTIERKPKKDKTFDKDEGEYVDYEEIE